MSIEQMRLFAEVVKSGSYTQAADRLDVSKGFLSKQVKQLEQQLGMPLLVRNTRTMRVTSAGEALYKEAVKLTTFWQETKTMLEKKEEHLAGKISCTAPLAVTRYLLWPIFHQLMAKHRDLNVVIDSGNTTRNLVSEDFDFAVRITNTPPEDMVARHLCRINYLCVASPDYMSKHKIEPHPRTMEKLDCLSLPHWKEWHFHLEEGIYKFMPSGKFVASDNELLKEACLQGVGVARLPNFMVQREIEQGTLVPIFPDIQGDYRELYLIFPQLSARAKRVSLCLEAVIQHFT
ncbi:LysR family transcriptional regulator [Thalassotalea euphylliae]|uniref:LysR family transcriptional regulator n=1 Tax=Thalassotalea euphylliae TaxID=1655234 RepID=UPI00363EC8B1